MTEPPITPAEREARIQELLNFGVPRGRAEEIVKFELGEFKGDVLEEED